MNQDIIYNDNTNNEEHDQELRLDSDIKFTSPDIDLLDYGSNL